MDNEMFSALLVITLIWLIIFFVTRELWCWYFKINERRTLQHETNELLAKLYELLKEQHETQTKPATLHSSASSTSKASAISYNSSDFGASKQIQNGNNPGIDYDRLVSMNVEQLNERGMIALEDHNWELANSCFSEALNKEPHNGEAHLGLLLAEKRQPDTDTWMEGIRKKNCSEVRDIDTVKIEVIKGFKEHVRNQEETYEIKGYVTREEIRKQYENIEYSYQSSVNEWTRRMQNYEAMVNGKQFRRVMRYTQGDLNNTIMTTLNDILAYMNTQYTNAVRLDEQNNARIQKTAPEQIAQADAQVRAMAVNANNQKEEIKRNRREKISRGINGTKEQLGNILKGVKN